MQTVIAPWVKDSNFYLLDHVCQGQKRAHSVGGYLNSPHWLTSQKKMTEYLPGQVVERGHPETGHHCPFPLL